MNKKETAQILAILKEYYPRDFVSTDMVTKVEAWYMILKDYDYNVMQNAVMSYVTTDTKGFMPVIGQLIEKVNTISGKKEMTEQEAWQLVYKALCNSAYNSVEEFNKLPPAVQRAVGSSEMLRDWALLDIDEIQTVVQSNVMRSFKTANKQEKEYEALPKEVKKFTIRLVQEKELKCLGE